MRLGTMMLAAAAALTVGSAARAQPAPDDMAERVALANRYFADMHLSATMQDVMQRVTPMVMDAALKERGGLTDAERTKVSQAASEGVEEAMADFMPKYQADVARVFAQIYTRDELQALTNFYESPVGVSIVNKMPASVGPTTQVMKALLPDLMADMRRHMCEHIACPTAQGPG